MPINPSIAMGYRAPRIQQPDPEAEMSRGLQLKSLLMQQRAADEARADDQAQRDAFRASGGDEAAYLKNLMQGGNVKGYQSAVEFYEKRKKAEADRLKAEADLKKTGADTAKVGAETAGILSKNDAERLTQHNNLLAGVASVEDGRAWVQLGVQSGAIKTDNAPFILHTFERAQSPEQLRDVVNRLALKMDEYIKQNKPTYQTQSSGQVDTLLALPGLGGAPSVVSSVQKVMTPGEVATDKRAREEGAANRGVQIRGQNLSDARARDANAINSSGNVIKTETELRKEFEGLPEVRRYKAALPAYNAVVSAAKGDNPQSDINLIYGLAKLYDPDSVVREGEYATIANSQAIPEWIKGQAQRLAGGGKLTKETKAQLIKEARGRIDSYEGEHIGARDKYSSIAKKRGADPDNIFTPVGISRASEPVDYDKMPGGGGGKVVDFSTLKR